MSDDDELVDLPPDGSLRGRLLRWARDLVLVVAGGVLLLTVMGRVRAPSLPEQAPAFTLADVDGQSVSLSDFAGQTVVLNFWATWCGPCRIEAPAFAAFAEAHPDVPVLGIAVDGPPAKVRRVAAELGMRYPILMADESVVRDYAVSMYPTTVVVDPDGTVRSAHAGMMLRPQLAWAVGRLW
ncbi:MAG: TlpA family protein disulfide reductase [Myxococcales bacterium]|nr:TlpA family protein disulfide reductase [Myxococcales bacterium]